MGDAVVLAGEPGIIRFLKAGGMEHPDLRKKISWPI